MAALDSTGFNKFLARLADDQASAADRYEVLRLKLTKFFVWKGTESYLADELADETLDRISSKVGEGLEIESVNAFSYSVARFVWLEHLRARKEEPAGDDLPEVIVHPEVPKEEDERLACLRGCLGEVAGEAQDLKLVTGYYDPSPGEKIKETRRRLAEELGITANTLKVRACRIRARLETCISKCVRKKPGISNQIA